MWILLLLLSIPIVEIALFIQIGGLIGLWPTLALIVLTAVVGAALMRRQGIAALARLQASVDAGEDPRGPIADGAFILIAGMLLLTPGFFTDAVGLILLVPAARAAVIRRLAGRMGRGGFVFVRTRAGAQGGTRRPRPGGDTIDGDYEVLDDVPPSQRGASGWTRPQN